MHLEGNFRCSYDTCKCRNDMVWGETCCTYCTNAEGSQQR